MGNANDSATNANTITAADLMDRLAKLDPNTAVRVGRNGWGDPVLYAYNEEDAHWFQLLNA